MTGNAARARTRSLAARRKRDWHDPVAVERALSAWAIGYPLPDLGRRLSTRERRAILAGLTGLGCSLTEVALFLRASTQTLAELRRLPARRADAEHAAAHLRRIGGRVRVLARTHAVTKNEADRICRVPTAGEDVGVLIPWGGTAFGRGLRHHH